MVSYTNLNGYKFYLFKGRRQFSDHLGNGNSHYILVDLNTEKLVNDVDLLYFMDK